MLLKINDNGQKLNQYYYQIYTKLKNCKWDNESFLKINKYFKIKKLNIFKVYDTIFHLFKIFSDFIFFTQILLNYANFG